jgi:hypothetical protein
MPRAIPRATIGGFPCLRSQTVRWTHTAGVYPDMHEFSLKPRHAQYLIENNEQPVTLEIQFKSKTLTIKNLYVVSEAPPDNPHVRKIMVADRRFWWDHKAINRDYNIRREEGVRRYVDQGAPQETALTSPIVRYWPWSLNLNAGLNAVTWKVSDIVKDILEDVLTIEKDKFGIDIETEYFQAGGKDQTDKIDIEQLSIPGDGGRAALSRLLSMVPALGITINDEGAAVVYRKDVTAKNAYNSTFSMGKPIDGGGLVIDVDNKLLRPYKIIIKCDREVELRQDSIEEVQPGQTFAEPNLEHRGMSNVGQVTDPYLTLRGEKYPQGTWMNFRDIIGLFPSRAGFSLTDKKIRECLVPFGPDLWQRLLITGYANPNVEWGARIAMIENCYRRTYQINWKYLSRLRSIRAYRIATVNQSTGARAPASVYSDYATVPSMRGQALGLVHDKPAGFVEENTGLSPADTVAFTNFYGWAANIKDAKPAPAFVRILDHDQGIILIDYQLSIMGMDKSVLPSPVSPNPTLDIRKARSGKHVLTTDSVTSENRNADHPALTIDNHISIIISGVPAGSNNGKHLHSIEITPAMVEAKTGVKLGKCLGPAMEIYLGPNVITAKIGPWQDERSDDFDKCCGLFGGNPNLSGLVLNDAESSEKTGASLQGTALGAAQQIWMSLIDRAEGQQEGTLTPNQEVDGWKEKVTHYLDGRGRLRTGIAFPARLPRINLNEYLDGNLRRAMLKLAQPP